MVLTGRILLNLRQLPMCISRTSMLRVIPTFQGYENKVIGSREYCFLSNHERSYSKKHTLKSVTNQDTLVIKRYKKTKSTKKAAATEEESDDESGDSDDEENPLLMDDEEPDDGRQNVSMELSSLRIDVVSKSAFIMARAKIEEAFYKGELRLNGEIPPKKSLELSKGDEVDVVKRINSEDTNMIDIKRIIIVDFPDKTTEQGRIKVQLHRWNDLTIPKYKD